MSPPLDLPTWGSLGDVDVASLPEGARPYVERLLAVAQSERAALSRGYDDARAMFNDTMKRIQSSDDPSKSLGEEYLQVKGQLESLQSYSDQMVDQQATTTWALFQRLHPELEVLPVETREAFADTIEQRLSMFDGADQLARLEKALDFAKWSTQIPVDAGRPVENTAVSMKQAAVATGRTPPAQSKPDISAMSVDEVLGQYMHILEESR